LTTTETNISFSINVEIVVLVDNIHVEEVTHCLEL